jgi:hypothetical protein
LVWPRLIDNKSRLVAITAALLAIALTPIAPAGVPIITTVVIAVIFGWKKS